MPQVNPERRAELRINAEARLKLRYGVICDGFLIIGCSLKQRALQLADAGRHDTPGDRTIEVVDLDEMFPVALPALLDELAAAEKEVKRLNQQIHRMKNLEKDGSLDMPIEAALAADTITKGK